MKKKRKNPEVAALTARVRAELEALGLAEPEKLLQPGRRSKDFSLRSG